MKTYSFFAGGSAGKGDTWSYDFDFELTDEEAARLEASARKEPRWHLDEDPEISDIYDKVYAAAYENELNNVDSDFIEELRDDYLSDDDNYEEPEYCEELGCWIKRAKPFTDRDFAVEYFDRLTFSICYPRDLQNLDTDSN